MDDETADAHALDDVVAAAADIAVADVPVPMLAMLVLSVMFAASASVCSEDARTRVLN